MRRRDAARKGNDVRDQSGAGNSFSCNELCHHHPYIKRHALSYTKSGEGVGGKIQEQGRSFHGHQSSGCVLPCGSVACAVRNLPGLGGVANIRRAEVGGAPRGMRDWLRPIQLVVRSVPAEHAIAGYDFNS